MIRNAGALVRGYVVWVRRLPQANGMMFAAQSSWGRSVKIGLFGIGVVLPLGSLIWALLFWHGNGVRKRAVVLPVDLTKTLPAPTGDS
ncbi:MAG: hypothetical protein KA435_00050 [Azonexus sp.]|nr:hypothetical protein [Azonexus sp.]MBP6201421.1 hypothetical protein [Azonexus sp.]